MKYTTTKKNTAIVHFNPASSSCTSAGQRTCGRLISISFRRGYSTFLSIRRRVPAAENENYRSKQKKKMPRELKARLNVSLCAGGG